MSDTEDRPSGDRDVPAPAPPLEEMPAPEPIVEPAAVPPGPEVSPAPVAAPAALSEPARAAETPDVAKPAAEKPAKDKPAKEAADGDGDEELPPVSPWVTLVAGLGSGMVAVVAVQVLLSLIEGLTMKSGQRVQIPDDLFHRLGYPFGGLGATALFFLVAAVVVLALPSLLGEDFSYGQDRMMSLALLVSAILGIVIAIGSLLAVRANLHEYTAKGIAIPGYVRLQFASFLLGALAAAALAVFGSLTARRLLAAERWED